MFRSEKGIALILVLSAIAIITALATEFAYNSNIYYHMATNARGRLQAYYLARSALNLMKLEVKLDKQMRATVGKMGLNKYVGSEFVGPLCQQFPFSTALLRAAIAGGGSNQEGEEVTAEEGEEMRLFTAFETAKIGEFLSFEGDFSGECSVEDAKWNLNYFYELNPTQQVPEGSVNAYDFYKLTLTKFLKQEKYARLFEDNKYSAQDIVRNIADWVDRNNRINEVGGVEVGSEASLYVSADNGYRVKNGKLLSLDEVYLVEGVKDDWFTTLKDNFTIYGGGKINVCLASDDVVISLILAYVEQNPGIPPVDARNSELMRNLVDAVRQGCVGAIPDVGVIEQSLDKALGVSEVQTGKVVKFASMISTEVRFYSFEVVGSVADSVVRIIAVYDVSAAKPKDWKLLYWRSY